MSRAERVLILRGAGAAFCTGLDLKEAADHTKAHATAEMVAKALITLSQANLVTIAAVHGAAVAGGAGIMSACDYVVAAEKTKIGYPEVRRGLVAGLVMTFLRRQCRERDIRELLLGSELIDATPRPGNGSGQPGGAARRCHERGGEICRIGFARRARGGRSRPNA